MKGKRIYPDENGDIFLAEGEYGKHPNGTWFARPPGCHAGNLANHDVVEHDDSSISVSPSILIEAYDCKWHGYLEHGIWREV
jgi:hypothetical protein